jgi:hypothetical protein
MKKICVGLGTLFCLIAFAATAQDSGSWDGLIEVKPKRVDAAYVLPGADFRPYTKIMLDPAEVALKKNWLKDHNQSTASLSSRLTQKDAERIVAEARKLLSEVFAEVFAEKGLQIVTAPGADVLRVFPGVVNLDVAAPDTMTAGRSRTYTMEAGEATLFLELRDSTTGALLGRALDRRATRSTGRASVTNRVTNISDFRALFKQWAEIAVKGFEDLHALSPVPEDLKPGQKLQP